jgi:hypothetical protein
MMPPTTAAKRRNGLAITGIVLAVLIWPVGLVLSIIALVSDAQTLRSQLNAAEAEAVHQSVQAKIGAMSSDLGAMVSGLQAIERGDVSQISQMEAAASKLQGDGSAIDSICSTL